MSPLAIPPVLCGLAPLEPVAPAAALAIAAVAVVHLNCCLWPQWMRASLGIS